MQPQSSAGPREAVHDTASLVLRQPRRTIGIVAISVAAWAFLAWMALNMDHPLAELTMPESASWDWSNALAIWSMWAIMMAAMMLPSALPMVLMFAQVAERSGERARSRGFAAGYLAVWLAFSVGATLAQWGLQAADVTDQMIVSTSPRLTALLLLVAGGYQFSPLKRLCLAGCRSPMAFLLGEWRPGLQGALVMGVRHGLLCLGCCWALMALLFVGGAMNLAWVAALSLAVAIEKLAPGGQRVATALGVVLVAGGSLRLLQLMS